MIKDAMIKKDELYKMIPNIDIVSEATQSYISSVLDDLNAIGRIDTSDLGALGLLTKNYELSQQIGKKLIEGTIPYTGQTGALNPMISLMNKCDTLCVRIMNDFGLTARARKALSHRDSSIDKTNGTIDEFLDN